MAEPKDIDYDPAVSVLKWQEKDGTASVRRDWQFTISPHERGKLVVVIPQDAYAKDAMSEDELAILMGTLQHLEGLVLLMMGLAPTKAEH